MKISTAIFITILAFAVLFLTLNAMDLFQKKAMQECLEKGATISVCYALTQ